MTATPRTFAIVTWRKTGALRFLGHLDIARAFDRAIRRAGLPVAYSQGFNPSAQMSFAAALPVGTAAENEICAIQLQRPMPAEDIRTALEAQLPHDLGVVDVRIIAHSGKRMYADLKTAEYEVELSPEPSLSTERISAAVDRLRNAGSLPVVRETKSRQRELDIRPGVHGLALEAPGDEQDAGHRLRMSLAFDSDNLVKPAEVIECLGRELADPDGATEPLAVRRIVRLGIY